MSEPEKNNYPYLESIKSFLPICDELIVVYNSLEDFQEDSLEKIKQLGVQVIGGIFNYKKLGWLSQGIMRTNGYYASTGDLVLMFDADDILHEKDIETLKQKLIDFNNSDQYYAFWRRFKFRQKETYTEQCKYPGVFKKRVMGNNFNFYGHYLAEANYDLIPEQYRRGVDLDFYLYGYERLWDDKYDFKMKLLDCKLTEFPEGAINRHINDKDYVNNWINNQREKVKSGKFMPIKDQPAIIQDKLNQITPEMFGYDNFGGI